MQDRPPGLPEDLVEEQQYQPGATTPRSLCPDAVCRCETPYAKASHNSCGLGSGMASAGSAYRGDSSHAA